MNLLGLNPWVILGVVVAFLGIGAAGYVKGRADANANCVSKVASIQAAYQKKKDDVQAASDKRSADLSKQLQDARAKNAVTVPPIIKYIRTTIHDEATCAVGADAVGRVWAQTGSITVNPLPAPR